MSGLRGYGHLAYRPLLCDVNKNYESPKLNYFLERFVYAFIAISSF